MNTTGHLEPIPVYTIGYGARSFEQFVAALRAVGITYVIDVRSVPFSRYKPEFSKKELENRLRVEGIRYIYLGDQLGGQPADRSVYVDDKVVYELLHEKPFFREGLARVRGAFEKQLPVVLMCSEGKPEMCHRSKLLAPALAGLGVPVLHIDEEDALRTQDEILLELTNGQLNLFGDPADTFTSRKRYRPPQQEEASDDASDDE